MLWLALLAQVVTSQAVVTAPTAPADIRTSIGKMPGWTPVNIHGFNSDIDTGTTPEVLWEPGGIYNWLAAPASLEAVSTSASDTSSGTGARTVLVNGLTSTFEPITAFVTMNGLTPVAIPGSFYRVNSMIVTTAGSAGTNVGSITLRVAGGGTIVRHISVYGGVGAGRSQGATYTVPAGNVFVLQFVQTSMHATSTSAAVTVVMRVRGTITTAWVTVTQWLLLASGSSFAVTLPPVVTPLAAGTDIEIDVLYANQTNNQVSITMLGTLVPVLAGL